MGACDPRREFHRQGRDRLRIKGRGVELEWIKETNHCYAVRQLAGIWCADTQDNISALQGRVGGFGDRCASFGIGLICIAGGDTSAAPPSGPSGNLEAQCEALDAATDTEFGDGYGAKLSAESGTVYMNEGDSDIRVAVRLGLKGMKRNLDEIGEAIAAAKGANLQEPELVQLREEFLAGLTTMEGHLKRFQALSQAAEPHSEARPPVRENNSIPVTVAAPRASASAPMVPDPAHKSNQWHSTTLPCQIFKTAVRTRDDVGRVSNPGKVFKGRLP